MKCMNGDCENTTAKGGGNRLMLMPDHGGTPTQRWICIPCLNSLVNGDRGMSLKPRTPLRQFAYEMERQLKANDDKGGWYSCSAQFLLKEATNHLNALKRTIRSKTKKSSEKDPLILDDAADVANFMMMIVDQWVAGQLEMD